MKHSYYTLAVLLMTAATCLGRPQTTIDSQQPDGSLSSEMDTPSPASNAWRKLYAGGFEPAQPRYTPFMEDTRAPAPVTSPLERLQMEFLRLAQQQNAIGAGSGSALPWEPMYRLPEMKRQVRYRQCYFNPISCFKK